jgi:predicted dehydrogenase
MAAGAALLPFTAASAQRIAGANEALRIGVIGCGARGTELMRDLLSRGKRRTPHRVVVACDACETHRSRASSLTGADAVPHWQDLVQRRDLDAIVVATPDHHHAAMSIAAMESGKDVYCERPMALRLDEAAAFWDVARRTGRTVQIGAQQTSQPQWRLAREIIRSGEIGDTVWCQGSYEPSPAVTQWERPLYKNAGFADLDWDAFRGCSAERHFDPDRFLNWRKYWDYSNGIAGQVFYHKLAALLIAVGPAFPERVSAAGGIYVRDGREVPDSFVMTAEYSGGRTIVLASSMANRYGLPAVIRGREASLEFHGRFIKIARGVTASNRATEMCCETIPREDHLANWLHCIRSRKKCVCNEDIGYQSMVAIAMAVESYRTGKTLSFDGATGRMFPSCVMNRTIIA